MRFTTAIFDSVLAEPTELAPPLSIRSPCRSVPTNSGRENRMAFTYKLEQEDGKPADGARLSFVSVGTAKPSSLAPARRALGTRV